MQWLSISKKRAPVTQVSIHIGLEPWLLHEMHQRVEKPAIINLHDKIRSKMGFNQKLRRKEMTEKIS